MMLPSWLHTTFQNTRSSKRVDELHRVCLLDLLDTHPEWSEYSPVFEKQINDGYGGTFNIDICLMEGDCIKVAILIKAINSNVLKNLKNYANTTIGESARLMYSPTPPESVLFLSIQPRIAPMFKSNGVVNGYDDVVRGKGRCVVDSILNSQYNGVVTSTDIYYDIVDVTSKKHKDEFQNIQVLNVV